MAHINKIMLIGNLGADPEVRYMPTGGAVANISLATTRKWKDKDTKEKRDQTEWHRVVFFNRVAEVVGEYLHKGSQVYVEGRLQTRKWKDKDGVDRYSTEIVLSGFNGYVELLGDKGDKAQDQKEETHENLDDEIPF